MPEAFVEVKACGEHLVVRVGPGTGYRGKPWLKKCWGAITGNRVVLEAYENDETVRPTTFAMVMAAVRAVFAMGFEAVSFTRIEDEQETEFLFTITQEGKITMSKKALHEAHGSKHSDGNFKTDHATVSPIITAYVAKLASGAFAIKGMSEIDLGNGLFARTFVIQE